MVHALYFTRMIGAYPQSEGSRNIGIVLKKQDGEMDIIELGLQDSNKVPTIDILSCHESFEYKPCPLRVNNLYMTEFGMKRGVDLAKLMYRLLRIMGQTVSYNLTNMNYETVATYLLTGKPNVRMS